MPWMIGKSGPHLAPVVTDSMSGQTKTASQVFTVQYAKAA